MKELGYDPDMDYEVEINKARANNDRELAKQLVIARGVKIGNNSKFAQYVNSQLALEKEFLQDDMPVDEKEYRDYVDYNEEPITLTKAQWDKKNGVHEQYTNHTHVIARWPNGSIELIPKKYWKSGGFDGFELIGDASDYEQAALSNVGSRAYKKVKARYENI